MINLYHRSEDKEYLDDPTIGIKLLRETYRELSIINIFTLGYWPTMSAVGYFLKRYGRNSVIKILDIGCGDGEILRRIEVEGRKRGFSLELTGIDMNPEAIAAAVQLSPPQINFICGDILVHPGDNQYDVIISSLTMHHLTSPEIVKLLSWMTTHAKIGWSISDLNRSAIAYYFAKLLAQLAGLNHVICHDAPLSVARSFRRKDWLDILSLAQLDLSSTTISWYPNFRYGIRYEK